VQLVFKISNLCAPDPATLQTDRHTDDVQSQYRDLHYSASRGKNEPTKIAVWKSFIVQAYLSAVSTINWN